MTNTTMRQTVLIQNVKVHNSASIERLKYGNLMTSSKQLSPLQSEESRPRWKSCFRRYEEMIKIKITSLRNDVCLFPLVNTGDILERKSIAICQTVRYIKGI